MRARPRIARHQHTVAGAGRADRVDRGLRRHRPRFRAHVVRLVHQAEDDTVLAVELGRETAPNIGERRHRQGAQPGEAVPEGEAEQADALHNVGGRAHDQPSGATEGQGR